MATIPPNWLSSIAGSQGAQHTSGTRKSRESAEHAARTGTDKFADSLQNVIENSDKDSEVYSDSEGLGSQGRATGEPEDQTPEVEPESDASDGGLDIEA